MFFRSLSDLDDVFWGHGNQLDFKSVQQSWASSVDMGR